MGPFAWWNFGQNQKPTVVVHGYVDAWIPKETTKKFNRKTGKTQIDLKFISRLIIR